MLHSYNCSNWKRGRFAVVEAAETYSSRFCYNEFDETNVVSVAWNRRTDSSLKLSLWTAKDKSSRTLKWATPVEHEIMNIR